MLQNRVDPFGHIISTSARGNWTGTRGLLHDTGKMILRPFKHKAWIICLLEFKNRKRQVMSPNLYTELFFLDEATAFAAGHRPCYECRRADYDHFKLCWINGNPGHGFTLKTSIRDIDAVLHAERIDRARNKVTFNASASGMPDGTFITIGGEPYLLANDKAHQWTPFGYQIIRTIPDGDYPVLTPPSTLNALRAGYRPQMALPAVC